MAHNIWKYTSLTGRAENLIIPRPVFLTQNLFREGKVHLPDSRYSGRY